MEIDKRSNLEHHVTEAATLAMTTVIHHQQILYQNHLKCISPLVSVSVCLQIISETMKSRCKLISMNLMNERLNNR